MELNLKNKLVLITGSIAGIGKATAISGSAQRVEGGIIQSIL